jgi:TetR/AcrR family transcriptional repressor of nem operon
MRATGTATRILDVAERLVQTQGFNGFSYADISKDLGITKASLHYHFPAKADLGRSLIERYCGAFRGALSEIDAAERDPRRKLRRYAELYAEVLRRDRMCLCGMLAADYTVLPRPMQEAVRAFFDANEAWLSGVLEEGRKRKLLRFRGAPREEARLLLGALEGAMLVARSYGDVARFSSSADRLLQDVSAG